MIFASLELVSLIQLVSVLVAAYLVLVVIFDLNLYYLYLLIKLNTDHGSEQIVIMLVLLFLSFALDPNDTFLRTVYLIDHKDL